MAEVVASAFVGVLIEKLLSGDLMKLAWSEGVNSQLKKWKDTLILIQDVLADAGQKHITQRAVETWLHNLQELAYDIDDVLDDLATEALKRKLNQESHASTSKSKVLKIIPTCCTNFTPHNIMYGRNMSSKLNEISSRLDDLTETKNRLGLDVNVKVDRSNITSRRVEQTSLIDESKVLGREEDKEALLEKLLGNKAGDQDVSIVSIVGLGGIGKTTLAKVLYNDKKVKDHFELRAWVCVSDEFDVLSISKAIYQAVTGVDKAFANLDLLHVALKEKLSKKRFLIVLDDVWNEDHNVWKALELPLVGAPGSKVIVTTRKTAVASTMNCVETHNLRVLSNEYAVSLLAKYALDEENFDKHPSLIPIAQCIIQKCDGLPLALIALGSILKRKGNDDKEWEELLKSEIWSSQDKSGILPALKLSYYDLPSHLKQLFAYCALFPKDYLFIKNELVLLWMAEGFLYQAKGNNMSMESLGYQYFEELQSRSFFQRSSYWNTESRYTMHDLMNDLAIGVAGDFFFMLDEKMDVNGRNGAFEKFRHFSFIGKRHATYRKFKELHRATRLRTFLPILDNVLGETFTLDNVLFEVLCQQQFLRVLNFSNCKITEIPPFIGSLKHLRYLNFSRTSIAQLPDQVSQLYNLQSLLVRDCRDLASLPVSFVKLINLRHLDMKDTPLLKKTPLGIGGLSSLQTLSMVCIEEDIGFKISELKDLVSLQGGLSIKGLEKVIDPIQANDANLQQKKGLDDIFMEWSPVFDDSRNLQTEYEVLEWLKPQRKLKTLRISYYGGVKFPTWLGDPSFDKLTKLRLEGCRNCKDFHSISFPSLEYLKISDMEVLQIWSNCDGDNDKTTPSFPHLREIHIENCPKLAKVSLGLIPSLEVLKIRRCSEAVLRAIISVSSAIQRLDMIDMKGLTKLEGEVLKHLQAVEDLRIEECDELRYLWDSESEACRFLVKLQKLHVGECKMLVSMEEKEANVGSSKMKSVTRVVTLKDCDLLESYNCPNSVEELKIRRCSSMTSLTLSTTLEELPSSLKILEINDCSNLNSFPHELPSSLKILEINGCSNLNSFPHELPPSLVSLEIGGCSNLNSFPHELPSSLTYLEINGCSNLNSFPHELPPSLDSLEINGCSNLNSFPHELPSSLTYLEINGCSNLNSFPHELPSSLKYLHITNCSNLNSFPLQHLQSLTSLKSMSIKNCESMDESFPCGLWPPNLTSLDIGKLKKPMSEWGLQNYPTSLVRLELNGLNSGVTSFAMEEDASNTDSTSFLLPPSLTSLLIKDFKDVESISEVSQHLTHLQNLYIGSCPNLRDVPKTTSSLRVHVQGV